MKTHTEPGGGRRVSRGAHTGRQGQNGGGQRKGPPPDLMTHGGHARRDRRSRHAAAVPPSPTRPLSITVPPPPPRSLSFLQKRTKKDTCTPVSFILASSSPPCSSPSPPSRPLGAGVQYRIDPVSVPAALRPARLMRSGAYAAAVAAAAVAAPQPPPPPPSPSTAQTGSRGRSHRWQRPSTSRSAVLRGLSSAAAAAAHGGGPTGSIDPPRPASPVCSSPNARRRCGS